jgi:hypothetical protein
VTRASATWAVEAQAWDGTAWQWQRVSSHRSRDAAVRAADRVQRRATTTGVAVRIVEAHALGDWMISTSTEAPR